MSSFQECYDQAKQLLDRNSNEGDEQLKQQSDLEVERLLKKAAESPDLTLSGEALLLLGICYSSVLFMVISRRKYSSAAFDSSFTLDVEARDKIWTDAVECLERASLKGNAKALFNLAIIYGNGECGQQKDQEKSNYYMQKSAEAGLADAQYAWGGVLFSESQQRDELDLDEKAEMQKDALSFYRLAASQSHPRAQCVAAVFLMNGIGCRVEGDNETKRLEEGVALFKESAASGLPDAQFALGRILERGEAGQAIDMEHAQYWYDRAERGGGDEYS